jgi:hypothetical protein
MTTQVTFPNDPTIDDATHVDNALRAVHPNLQLTSPRSTITRTDLPEPGSRVHMIVILNDDDTVTLTSVRLSGTGDTVTCWMDDTCTGDLTQTHLGSYADEQRVTHRVTVRNNVCSYGVLLTAELAQQIRERQNSR